MNERVQGSFDSTLFLNETGIFLFHLPPPPAVDNPVICVFADDPGKTWPEGQEKRWIPNIKDSTIKTNEGE